MENDTTRASAGSRDVDMPLICEATGLPMDYLTPENIRRRLMPGIAVTFCDGEVMSMHAPETDAVGIEHFGVTNYAEGTFGERLREALNGGDKDVSLQADRLIRMAAYIFTQDVIEKRISLPAKHMAAIDPVQATLTFDEHTVPLTERPATVIDYGPGLQGRFHVKRQIMDFNAERVPYAYFALAKGPFINEFLMEYWMACSSREFFKNKVLGRGYIGREDGMASATDTIIAVQTAHTGKAAMADVVLASGIYTAGFAEVERGIANAYTLLNPGGSLLIRAPKAAGNDTKNSNIVPAEAMVTMAGAAGFDTNAAQYFDVITGPGPTPTVQTLSAVFRK